MGTVFLHKIMKNQLIIDTNVIARKMIDSGSTVQHETT
jgi:hypothetical protein